MKQLAFALLLALALPIVALAQTDENPCSPDSPPAENTGPGLTTRNFGGFAIDLPGSGTLETPASPDWDEDEQVIFNWFGDEGDPVVLIQCRVDSFEDDLQQDAYDIFCDTLLSNWLGDDASYTVMEPPKPPSEDTPRRTRNNIGTHNWNLITIDDHSDINGGRIYYSIFCTWNGPDIYTISFYYLNPLTKEDTSVKDFGKPILASFRVAGEGKPDAEAPAAN